MTQLNVFVRYLISEFCLNQEEKQDPDYFPFVYSLFKKFISQDDASIQLDSFIPELIEHLLPISYQPKEEYLIRLDDEIRDFIDGY